MSISANVSAQASVMVPLARVPTDESAQTRVRIRAAVVRDYAAAMLRHGASGAEHEWHFLKPKNISLGKMGANRPYPNSREMASGSAIRA
jgi:hypothetical protein